MRELSTRPAPRRPEKSFQPAEGSAPAVGSAALAALPDAVASAHSVRGTVTLSVQVRAGKRASSEHRVPVACCFCELTLTWETRINWIYGDLESEGVVLSSFREISDAPRRRPGDDAMPRILQYPRAFLD